MVIGLSVLTKSDDREAVLIKGMISSGNRTEWSAIQGVIQEVRKRINLESNLKLRARLPLNCTTRSPITD